ncbi:MAG: hypothetical protein FWF01_02670 [Alphaproteobacteria bacterium]|nr:hypothetical protein [Alphaproteobacteria bacterium]
MLFFQKKVGKEQPPQLWAKTRDKRMKKVARTCKYKCAAVYPSGKVKAV